MLTAPKSEWSNPDLKCRCCGAPALVDDLLKGETEHSIEQSMGIYIYQCGAQIRRIGFEESAFFGEVLCPNATRNFEK